MRYSYLLTTSNGPLWASRWKGIQMKPSIILGLIIALAAVGLIFLTVSKTPAQQSKGNFLIYARSADSSTLDPQEMEWGEDVKVAQNIFETLVKFSEEPPKVEPLLAERWEVSPDGLTYTFFLRPNVKFQDGTAFDAEAVVFAMERLLNPEHPQRPAKSVYASFYQDVIASVKAAGSHKAIFKLKKRSAVFLQLIAIFPAGIPSPTAVKADHASFPRHPIGTGPFKLDEWKSGEKIVLGRHPEYWGAPAALSRLIFIPVQNPQTAIQKLKLGEAHMMDHLTLADIEPLEKEKDLTIAQAISPNVLYLAFNMNKEAFPYNDLHFRKAVGYALDRSLLNKQVYYGLAAEARNIVPPVLWSDIGELGPYEFNLEKAKAELAQVKLPEGFVAEVWAPDFGRPYMPEPGKTAEFIKDQLTKLGLDVKIQMFEKASYTKKTKEATHPMCLLGWMADYPDPDNFLNPLLHGQFSGQLNISFFNDPKFNELVQEGGQVVDWEKRKAAYLAAAKIYREQRPSLALVHTRRVFALRNSVEYKPHPIDYRIHTARLNSKNNQNP